MIFSFFFSICSCRSCLAHLRLSGGGLSLQNRFSSRDSALSPWRKKSCAATAQLLSRLMVACLWTTKVFRCHVLRLPAIEDFLPCSHFRLHNTGMYCVLALTEESHVVRSWMVLYDVVSIRWSASSLSKLSERWAQVARATHKVKQSLAKLSYRYKHVDSI